MSDRRAPGVSFHDLADGGRVGAVLRERDWSGTALGPRSGWSRSLQNHLAMIFELPGAAIIFWGPTHVQLYNDGYSVIMGPRHPRYLGSTFEECWPEVYEGIHPWMERVLTNGESVEVVRTLVPLTRFGFLEEAYFTFTFSPLRDDDGRIAGVLNLVTEVTDTVIAERRTRALLQLANLTARAKTIDDAIGMALDVLASQTADLPFCLVYRVHTTEPGKLSLSGHCGLGPDSRPFPTELDLRSDTLVPEVGQVVRERHLVEMESLVSRFAELRSASSPESPDVALASPILAADQQTVVAVMICALSPRLAPDAAYRGFLQLVCAQVSTLLGAAQAYDDERRRAEALAAIDRAKTEFFSNVSHELRTPLTLILGPVESALANPELGLSGESLEAVHRSTVRLLRLVNSLLDFARIEGGRFQLSFVETDVGTLTADLASSFRSLVERAGLALTIDCPKLDQPTYVDPLQWEKIVLNLLSNAFKFTLDGEIAVRLRASGSAFQLIVRDTGIGISEEDLSRVFERFHRVEGAAGRSYEGTGIGLSLVRELVTLHGGSIRAQRNDGPGSTFEVVIPMGKSHLPPDRIVEHAAASRSAAASTAYLLEAAAWLGDDLKGGPTPSPEDPAAGTPGADAKPGRARILVVDDNADMRAYLARLMRDRWEVELAPDGELALAKARAEPFDLVLTDVMMPKLDGFGLLRELRADPRTRQIPVVLLSARAGEEALLEGLETGADDYLVKPFAARELLARVQTHLDLARQRRDWAGELQRANEELEAFSYSVSHDLRSPLRAIEGFSRALLDDHAAQLDDRGRHYLERVRSGAQRMALIIDDLLRLSRVTRAPMVREDVDLGALARRLLGELAVREPDRQVEIDVSDGMVARADARLVAVLLENLLGNAWKFTSQRPVGHITVARREGGGSAVFLVRDDGAGFSMDYSKKLFAPFERLHSESEFPGTGIGLAIVQRVVNRHDGRVWAESKPGEGATFFFTLGGNDAE